MSFRIRHGIAVSLAFAAAFMLCVPAHAYFWWGVFDGYPNPRPFRWSLNYMDTNGDGDVNGPNEGIEITYESGPFGWTDDEMDVLDEAFAVFENVPTTFIGFRFGPTIEGPLEITEEGIDFINYITIQDPDAPGGEFEAALPTGVLGITQMTMAETDLDIPFENDIIFVPIGTIVECDIVFQGFEFRPDPGEEPGADLLSVAVHEIGHMLAMGHTPLNNVRLNNDVELLENPAVSWRNAGGELEVVGATPTMFPAYFLTQQQNGQKSGGNADLAPDDIACITYLYPRQGGLDEFFSIADVARTQSRPGFPSAPIAGGHIVAWADTDNNEGTPRIPLISTMTGLYEPPYATQARGKFDLRGLPKQLETLGSPDPFNATYTLSINELDSKGFEDQAPPLINTDAPIIDTTHLFNPLDARDVYDDTYPEEVFHESGEVFDLDNVEAGTELYWDPASQAVLSALTGDTLPEMLNGEPMFGDTNEICPVLALTAGLPTQHGPNLLRAFRDGVLVKTAAGKAFVRWYYRVSPSVVTYLRDHAVIYQIGRGAAIATEFALAHIVEMIAMAALGIAGWKLRRRRQLAATALVCLGAFALSLGPAQAMTRYMSEAEVIHVADLIVVGTVTLVESRELGDRHRIVTDITIEIDTTLKGTGNKGSEVFIRQPGGRVNGLRTFASELPMFTQGEEVLLYLEYREGSGYAVVGGARGMYGAKFDEATKEYNIKAPQAEKEIAAKAAESGASKALKESNSTDGYVAVSILKAYIASVLESAAP